MGRRWTAQLLPWPLAIVQLGVVATVATLGPLLTSATLVAMVLFVACLAVPVGFVVITLVVSQLSNLPGLSDVTVFALKWVLTLALMGLLVLRFGIEKRRISLQLDGPERVLVLFAIWSLLCSLFASHRLATFSEALRIAVYPIVVIVVRETLTTRRDLALALLGYALAALIGTGYSVIGDGVRGTRFAGFSGNANIFGLFLSFTVPVLVAGWYASKGFLFRIVLQASAALSTMALFLSWSRASMLSVIVQVIVASFLFRKFKLLLAGAVLASAAIAVVLLTPNLRDLAFTAFRFQAGTTHRTLLWSAGLESAVESPIVGHGFGLQVSDVVDQVKWGNWQEAFVFKSEDNSFNVHNLYLHLILSTGLPGLALFLVLCWLICRRHLNGGRTAVTPGLRIANYTIVAMVIGSLFNGLFESAVMIGRGAISNYFWIAVGIVAAYEKIEGKSKTASMS